MKNQHLRVLVLAGAFCACGLTPAYGQWLIAEPEILAGSWEVNDPAVGNGLFLSITTHGKGKADPPSVAGQRVQIRVSYRRDGQKTWGWYVAAPADVLTEFDGQHLRIRSIRNTPALDLTFDADARRWTGTWSHEGQSRVVTLERPRPSINVAPNPWRGSWEGVPDASGKAQTRVHIDQSSDGTLSAWMDRDFGFYQNHGELLAVVSLEGDTITLSTTNPGGRRYTFLGRLSADGLRLSGSWDGDGGGGGTLNASESFLRMPQEQSVLPAA
jgi:hypothetical protein